MVAGSSICKFPARPQELQDLWEPKSGQIVDLKLVHNAFQSTSQNGIADFCTTLWRPNYYKMAKMAAHGPP